MIHDSRPSSVCHHFCYFTVEHSEYFQSLAYTKSISEVKIISWSHDRLHIFPPDLLSHPYVMGINTAVRPASGYNDA